MAKASQYDDAARQWEEPIEASPIPAERISGIHIRRVVNEFHPVNVTPAKGKYSFGGMIDEMIGEALANNGQVQSVEVEITDADWQKMRHEHFTTR